MKMPLVSIVIPTYNRAGMVSEAIDSALGQSYNKTEVIVVDDGSTDGTEGVLKRYGDRIRVIRQKNAGCSAARNKGIEASRGEIVAFLDSDDLWLPIKIERQVAVLEKVGSSISCCWCNTRWEKASGEKIDWFDWTGLDPAFEEGVWTNVADVVSTRFILFTQAIAIRRDVLSRIGGFDETLWVMEDHHMALKLALIGPWGYAREPLVVIRSGVAENSLWKQAYADHMRYAGCIERVYRNILRDVEIRSPIIRRRLKYNLRATRHELLAARMIQKSNIFVSGVGRTIRLLYRVRDAAYRRSPWYPHMEVMPLSCCPKFAR